MRIRAGEIFFGTAYHCLCFDDPWGICVAPELGRPVRIHARVPFHFASAINWPANARIGYGFASANATLRLASLGGRLGDLFFYRLWLALYGFPILVNVAN